MKTYRLIKNTFPNGNSHYTIQRKTWFGWITLLLQEGTIFNLDEAKNKYQNFIDKNKKDIKTVILTNEIIERSA